MTLPLAPQGALRAPTDAAGVATASHWLRAMTVEDLDAVMALEVRQHPCPWSRGHFADSLVAGHWARCLVTPQGDLHGYVVAMPGFEEWHLLNVTVSPDVEGQGLGRLLLDQLRDHARATVAPVVWLEVRPSNVRALRLYERYGFAQVGVRRGYYPTSDGGREDAVVMRLDVPVPDRVDPTGGSRS